VKDFSKHIIHHQTTVRQALQQLDELGTNLTLFVHDEDMKLVGTVTDGDIRRGLIKNLDLSDSVERFMHKNFRYVQRNNYDLSVLEEFRAKLIWLIPVVDEDFRIIRFINLKEKKSILPVDAVIMAGGKGERLRPLTDSTPKPLLKVGDKPIIEHNIDRMAIYGIDNIYITIKYLGQQIIDYLQDGTSKDISIKYVSEEQPLGTIGALSKITAFIHDYILIMNSDLLTNIDFEDFFKEFLSKEADMAVATIPYQVDIPYAILETNEDKVISFKEKPTYTYFANSGIYLIKKDLVNLIPKEAFYNATDFMEELINIGKKVIYYPLLGYWLDIGQHKDFKKAQEDIKHIKL
jgi:dTDP-glucose pyrophosphorylase